jgi:hypothetical protein
LGSITQERLLLTILVDRTRFLRNRFFITFLGLSPYLSGVVNCHQGPNISHRSPESQRKNQPAVFVSPETVGCEITGEDAEFKFPCSTTSPLV